VVTLGDLLLMFLYLEVLSMVSHYFSSGRMPVRYPLYIGMVALARYLILEMKEMDGPRILMITAAILVLAFAVLVVRYGHLRFPYPPEE
jgi:protein PsiE